MNDPEQAPPPAAAADAAPVAPPPRGAELRRGLLQQLPKLAARERRPEGSLDTEEELQVVAECDVDELLTPLERVAGRTR